MNDPAPVMLGDYLRVKHGFAFKGEYFTEEAMSDVLVTPGNFAIGGGFRDGNAKYYDGPVLQEFVLQASDLVVTMTDLSKEGDTLGYPALIPDAPGRRYLHNQRIGLVEITRAAELDKRFLFYRLRARDYRQHILATASGSTVRHTSPGRICEFKLTLPPLQKQRAIAAALGVLDDKINQNRLTARAMEELARSLFRAWFVDFEPVRAKARGATAFPSMPQQVFDGLPDTFTDSELGEVPAGWQLRALSDVFAINPSRPLRKGEPAPYLDMKNMPTESHAPQEWGIRSVGSGARFANGDTLVARITPCLENGKTAFVDFLEDGQFGWGSTEYIVLRPEPPVPGFFAYLLARTPTFRSFAITNMTGSSGRQRVPLDVIAKFPVAVAPGPVMAAFDDIVRPLFAYVRAMVCESRKLGAMRDSLLPAMLFLSE